VKKFTSKIQKQFTEMCKTGKLFRVELHGEKIWELYLKSFDADPIFRDPESSEHNCNNCKNFIRRYGNIVVVSEDYKIVTMFDVEAEDEFVPVAKALSKAIKKAKITEVFFETFDELNGLPYEKCTKKNTLFQLGMEKNVKQYTKEEAEKFGRVEPSEIRTFDHLHLFVDKTFVDMSGKSVEALMGEYRDAKAVFQRAMETISLDTLELVRDLINQGSLLDGQAHLYKIEEIIPLKKEYDSLGAGERDNWCWVKSYKLKFAKFRNELIGVLCSELSEGKELNDECKAWNYRVDPVNYMKTTAPITKKQIEEAKLFVEENGYEESFNRRFANIDDIKVSEIIHSNVGKGEIKNASIFDGVKSTSTRHKRSEFDGVEEISIDKFMKDIIPTCTGIEVFLRNIHEGNMVSLTTANNPESKPIFKWDNNYSWTFNGNLAGKSQIKDAVASKGGKVDGVLRFSIMWAEGDASDNSDLDAWAQEPNGTRIGYSTSFRKDRGGNTKTTMGGQLDVDITQPNGYSNKNIVENIVWDNLSKMKKGTYKFWVNQFADRGSKGFKAEIEFDGEIYSYEFNKNLSQNKDAHVAEVTLDENGFSIKHILPESHSSKEIYGLETNQFHKVNLVCLSPNHWGKNNVGNKHYLFMLDGCKSNSKIRSFHNENLNSDLTKHRKVMEILGTTNMIEANGKELSGLGYNSTVHDSLTLRLSGSYKRIIKVKFGNG
jgi:hypothetical protein